MSMPAKNAESSSI